MQRIRNEEMEGELVRYKLLYVFNPFRYKMLIAQRKIS